MRMLRASTNDFGPVRGLDCLSVSTDGDAEIKTNVYVGVIL